MLKKGKVIATVTVLTKIRFEVSFWDAIKLRLMGPYASGRLLRTIVKRLEGKP